jgi:lysozyme
MESVIELLLQEDIEEAESELDRVLPEWASFDVIRRRVLVDMMFNLGAPRFMSFNRFRRALMLKDFDEAAKEMLLSKWAEQVGIRAERLSEMMRTGNDY